MKTQTDVEIAAPTTKKSKPISRELHVSSIRFVEGLKLETPLKKPFGPDAYVFGL